MSETLRHLGTAAPELRTALVDCRRPGCGPHPVRERAVACKYCRTDCWDHHAVCGLCFAAEALERHADEVIALVEERGVT